MLAASLVEVTRLKAHEAAARRGEARARRYGGRDGRTSAGLADGRPAPPAKAPFDGAPRPQLAARAATTAARRALEAELAPEESGLPLDDLNGRASTWRWLGALGA